MSATRSPEPQHEYDDNPSARQAGRPTGELTKRATQTIQTIKYVLRVLGPGFIAGGADDDPTAIGTYAQAGAQTGYGLLWTTVLTVPMMSAAQYISAKVAVVHREGLTQVLRRYFPAPVVYLSVLGLIVANVINMGADLGAMAAAVNLFVPVPIAVIVVPVTLVVLALLIFGSYPLLISTFKWLTLAHIAYIVSAILAKPDLGAMLKGTFVPSFSLSTDFLSLLVATLGGNVSPYLFFWQADLEVEGELQQSAQRGRFGPSVPLDAELKDVATDTNVGMIFSNVIVYFIEVSTAATLFRAGIRNVNSATDAAKALVPFLGRSATLIWGLGMVGAGMLTVPALAGSAADAVAQLFGWGQGTHPQPGRTLPFYSVLAASMLSGMAINFVGINPIQALVLAAALNGILAPPLLALLLIVSNKRDVMGANVNGRLLNVAGWGTVVIMSLAAIALIYTTFWS